MELNVNEKPQAAENDRIERKEDLKEDLFPRKRGWANLGRKLAANTEVTRKFGC